MKIYYKFTKLINDKDSFKYFESLSNDILKNILDDTFNDINDNINNYAHIFKKIFNYSDYDEFYYSCLLLCEELNDIKIILNILMDRQK